MRLTETAKKCIALFMAYTRRELTFHELSRKLDAMESKQIELPIGRKKR